MIQKMFLKGIVKKGLLLTLFSCFFGVALANPPGGGDGSGSGSGSEPDNPDVPVDGGVSFLVVAGAVYGVSRLKRKK